MNNEPQHSFDSLNSIRMRAGVQGNPAVRSFRGGVKRLWQGLASHAVPIGLAHIVDASWWAVPTLRAFSYPRNYTNAREEPGTCVMPM